MAQANATAVVRPIPFNKDANRLRTEDCAVHDWYRFVLSFPPHLVRDYVGRFGIEPGNTVLDPFCGTGTTLVECRKLGIDGIGIEANPMPCFASRVKLDWSVNPDALLAHARNIADLAAERLDENGLPENADLPLFGTPNPGRALRSLPQEREKLLLTNSISPAPLHRTLELLQAIDELRDNRFYRYERLALAKALVSGISNLEFGPEVGVGRIKNDAPTVSLWLQVVTSIVRDLQSIQTPPKAANSTVYRGDARQLFRLLGDETIDAVITSPPYPNEKDYTRTTRLESVLLGFIRNKQELRGLKQDFLRSNTRGVFKADRDDLLVMDQNDVQDIADAIEKRRIELAKTSGFERLYARVTKLYFGGMTRHLSDLRSVLRPGAQLAYVVGDQASYLRVLIKTGQVLADIAKSLGYEVTGIDLFRTRLATATRAQLREEVLLLRWPGTKSRSRITLMNQKNAYTAIIERIFHAKYKRGKRELDFEREELAKIADELKLDPKNLGDLIYSFRYRAALPDSIQGKAGEGETWIIRPAGRGKYRFVLVPNRPIAPNTNLATTKVPDATPGVVSKYALSDEQALLAKVRYNRLIDVFTGVACYSLQNHLRTTAPNMGQVETDEIYIGVDKRGAHYVFPVQAKGGNDKLHVVQIEQDVAVCTSKFPSLICRPIGAQFMAGDVIALFEFEEGHDGIVISSEKHYKLVPQEEVTAEDLDQYRKRPED